MQFVAGVSWRLSQRGLVVSGHGGSPLLVEHARASDLPHLVSAAANSAALVSSLGGTDTDRQLVDDLLEEQIVAATPSDVGGERPRRVVFTRSGVEFTGIDAVARVVHRAVMPVLVSWPGRIVIAAVMVGGVVAVVSGRPDGPAVSQHPWMDATLGLALGLVSAALHELAHAVALVHYGRTPRRAGCGFYWGALCFYVDSSDGITLSRRARVINALAGLAVNAVVAAGLLIVSHAASAVLIVSVCWRIAILEIVAIVENGLPILEVDGYVAFSDYLDEPDLAPRSREALSRKLRGFKHAEQPSWLAAYGAFSLIGGVVLLATSTWIWWLAAGELITSLFGGNVAEILLGLYVVVPFALAVVFSVIGLLVELLESSKGTATHSLVKGQLHQDN